MYFAKLILVAVLLSMVAACGDNLIPSGKDKRPAVIADSTGGAVGQKAADFSVSDINGATVNLSSSLAGRKGAVFYFTMWCPICDSHMSNMRSSVVPLFPDIGFYLVDYLSGTVTDAANAASASGYSGGTLLTLADTAHTLQGNFQATMGTSVVVDSVGTVRLNEDYRDGTRLKAELSKLQENL